MQFMLGKKSSIHFVAACAVLFGLLASADSASAASKEKVLYSFCSASGCTDGDSPLGGLVFDAAGNLYGTTFVGGEYGQGTVFQLTPGANGTWTETVLYNFCPVSGCPDGADPTDGSLIFDAAGNLYGTTQNGGVTGGYCSCGVVFELSPSGDGTWTETVLYEFQDNGTDGFNPETGVIFDAAGNLYGTAFGGSACPPDYGGCGTVFRLSPGAHGTWTETVIYNFCSAPGCTDGMLPAASLAIDSSGNLYGTTFLGGTQDRLCGNVGCGVVFELMRGAKGKWKEKVLHRFNGKDGSGPAAELIFDAAGNLYGTTDIGGAYGNGTVFQLTRSKNGKWTERVLRNFTTEDGNPGGLVFDAAGKMYGTTSGGAYGYGAVIQLTRSKNGKWAERVLHSFGRIHDGVGPGSVVFDTAGSLYGITGRGGTYNRGTVFEITP
jgi:uncharacterized repeat protein (TIGR03803 family)